MSTSPAPAPRSSLDEVRALARQRDWPGLAQRAAEIPEAELYAEADAALHYADALWRIGESARALEVTARVEAALRPRGGQRLLLDLINIAGIALWQCARIAEAEGRFAELLERASAAGDDEFAARASNNLGMVANLRGERELALTYYERALASYQRLGYLRGLAQTHHNLGISYRDLGFLGEADAHYQRAVGYATAAESEDVVALAETERAVLRVRAGDGELAERMARRAIGRFEGMGDPLGRGEALRVLASALRLRGAPAEAARRLEEALDVARAHADALLHAEVQRDRGTLLHELGDPPAARAALLDAAEQFTTLGATAEAEAVRAQAEALTG